MSNTRVEDEFTGIQGAQKRYYMRLMRDKKACGKCLRCAKDALIVTRVGVDGGAVSKRLTYCGEHQAYFSVFNKQARDKKKGAV